MDKMESTDLRKLKDDIKKIINKIKDNRNRPCYQNILTFYNRGRQESITEETLTLAIEEMVKEKEIKNNAKDGKDSFSINPASPIPVNTSEDVSAKDDDSISKDPENVENLEDFINEQFYAILISKIKEEVKVVFDNISNFNNEKDLLIANLRSEVNFLREQACSFSKIFELVSSNSNNSMEVSNLSKTQIQTILQISINLVR